MTNRTSLLLFIAFLIALIAFGLFLTQMGGPVTPLCSGLAYGVGMLLALGTVQTSLIWSRRS